MVSIHDKSPSPPVVSLKQRCNPETKNGSKTASIQRLLPASAQSLFVSPDEKCGVVRDLLKQGRLSTSNQTIKLNLPPAESSKFWARFRCEGPHPFRFQCRIWLGKDEQCRRKPQSPNNQIIDKTGKCRRRWKNASCTISGYLQAVAVIIESTINWSTGNPKNAFELTTSSYYSLNDQFGAACWGWAPTTALWNQTRVLVGNNLAQVWDVLQGHVLTQRSVHWPLSTEVFR